MTRPLLSLALLLILPITTDAQSLRGRLIDTRSEPIRYATIALLRSQDSSVAQGAVSDSAGIFAITAARPDVYLIRVSAIGFGIHITAPIRLNQDDQMNLGDIALQPEARSLDAVTIASLRPVIRQLADRLEVTIEGTTMAAGSTAWSVLSKMPGVFIDNDGNIMLNGRAGVRIMLDEKQSYLTGADLRNLLESMPAENIRNIGIITNPSARYDAEGTAGIININFRKATQQGVSGNVYANYSHNFHQQHSYWGGATINYKTGAWSSSLGMDAAHHEGGRNATFTRIFYAPAQTTYFDQTATGSFKADNIPSLRLSSDYTLNAKQSIGAALRYARRSSNSDFLTDTYLGSRPGMPNQYIDADNFNTNNSRSFTANLHYVNKLDTSGSQLSADLDYVSIRNGIEGNYFNFFNDLNTGKRTEDPLYTNTPNGYDIYAAKLDLIHPLAEGHSLEAGLKWSAVASDNDSRFYVGTGPERLDTTRTNHFRYDERIYAAYLNWKGKLAGGWSAQAGLRAEHTVSKGESLTTGAVNDRSYFGLFPSVFLQKDFSADYSLGLNYGRRLTRPSYGNLNPFRAYRDPYTWYEGNPDLRPQYTHSVSLRQTFKKAYNFSISYELMKDVIAEVPVLNVEKAITVYTTGNVRDAQSLDATLLIPLRISKGWDAQNTLQLSHNTFRTAASGGEVVNRQTSYMLRSIHTILLPLSLRLEVTLLYQGPQAWGLYRMEAVHRVDAGIKRSFFDKHLDVTINANDIFKGVYYRWSTDINGNVNDFDQYFRIRSIGLSLRYNFAQGQKVEIRTRSMPEELNRT